jgi:uncharacterized protein YcnI
MHSRRRAATLAATVLSLSAAGTLWATTASAHVTVAAPGVVAGASDASITFRVPDESSTAGTIGVKVQLPTDHPIAGVLVAPIPGWTATVKNTTLATPLKTDDGEITEVVSEIDWTAGSGSAIKPGFFGQFTIIAGKLPDGVSSLTFTAVQTYSDNSTVSWIEQAAPGSAAQPEHPAPVLELAAATPDPSASASTASAAPATSGAAPSVSAVPAAATGNAASKSSATTGIILGGIGVVLGAAALFVALTRGRRTHPDTAA